MIVVDTWRHGGAFAIRYINYFDRLPVQEELTVRAGISRIPVRAPTGQQRQDDGTYRFIDLPPGVYDVDVESPSGSWMSASPLSVVVPKPDAGIPIECELWPTPQSRVPAGVTAIRGKLVGTGTSNLRVNIDDTTGTGSWFTHADGFGEFLFLFPFRLEVDAGGRVNLRISVPDRLVSGGEIWDGVGFSSFGGSTFGVPPGRELRAKFNIT